MEEERVRGTIADILYQEGFRPYVACSEVAKRILAIKGIRLETDNQSLPELICKDIQMPVVRQATGLAQQEMLEPDSKGKVWVKVL